MADNLWGSTAPTTEQVRDYVISKGSIPINHSTKSAQVLTENIEIYEEYLNRTVDRWTAVHLVKYFWCLNSLSFGKTPVESWPKSTALVKGWLSSRSVSDISLMVENLVLNWDTVRQQNKWITTECPTMGLLSHLWDSLYKDAVSGGTTSTTNRVSKLKSADDGVWG